jgi:hypothetical protein
MLGLSRGWEAATGGRIRQRICADMRSQGTAAALVLVVADEGRLPFVPMRCSRLAPTTRARKRDRALCV